MSDSQGKDTTKDKKQELAQNPDEEWDESKGKKMSLEELTSKMSKNESQALLDNLARMFNQQEPKQKPIEEHKFWRTQPVLPQETVVDKDGEIGHQTVDEVPKTPQSLPDGFQWDTPDIRDPKQVEEIYQLLYENYIEDAEEQFRFKYSAEFLKWALQPPGWVPEWNVGVRATKSGKLLAFIAGIPAELQVRENKIKTCEINFLCVHKQLRSKRMAPVLIKEVTRRVNLKNVWQALYTAGKILPTPVSSSRYYHRTINWSKLYDVGFAYLPEGQTKSQMIARNALPNKTDLPGFRELTEQDIPQTYALFTAYIKQFELHQVFSEEDFKHWMLNPVVKAYVVELEGKITDFVSFYGVDSTVIGNALHNEIKVAYVFYYATAAPEDSKKRRLQRVLHAAMVMARSHNYDVLNALTLMDNPLFLENLKFAKGDGTLYYYLFNWKTNRIDGGSETKPGKLGVVLL